MNKAEELIQMCGSGIDWAQQAQLDYDQGVSTAAQFEKVGQAIRTRVREQAAQILEFKKAKGAASPATSPYQRHEVVEMMHKFLVWANEQGRKLDVRVFVNDWATEPIPVIKYKFKTGSRPAVTLAYVEKETGDVYAPGQLKPLGTRLGNVRKPSDHPLMFRKFLRRIQR